MREPVFTGACTAIVTPFDANGAVNYDAFGKLIDQQIAAGVDAICVCGTTGETSTLSIREHIAVVEYCVKRVNHRVKVVAGAGSNDTSAAVYLSQHAQDSGADALLLVTPYYNKASQTGLIKHYEYIADRVELPIILYNVPSRTGVNIAPATYRELAKHPNIVAVKEACGNISQIAQTMQLCGDELDLYSGNDDQIVPLLSLGGKGVISVLSNVAPRQTHEICQLFFDGKVSESRQLQLQLLPLINALFSDVNPIPVKEAMNLLGWHCGECRLPLTTMQSQAREQLAQCLRQAGLIA